MIQTPAFSQRMIKAQGNYRVAGFSGALTGAGAASDIVSFRWGSTTLDCIIWWIKWYWNVTTGFTGAQVVDHALYFARKFTGSPSGGTDLKPAAGMSMKRTSYPSSALTAFQIAGAGALTIGTRTLDTNPLMSRGANVLAAGLQGLPDSPNQFDPDLGGLYLTQDEGFVLQNVTAMGAAGVIKLGFEVAWSEIVKDAMFIPDNLVS